MSDNPVEESLWGNLPLDSKMETPVGILKSQANALSQISVGMLDGRVKQFEVREDDSRGRMGYELQIVVPALANYSISIVSIFQPLELYPAVVFADLNAKELVATNSDELKSHLREVFQSQEVRKLLIALIAQANDAGEIPQKPRRRL